MDSNDIKSDPKIEHSVHLLYDVLTSLIYKVDPWFIE